MFQVRSVPEHQKWTELTNNFVVVGRKWMKGFLRRHNEITFRTPESVSSASAKVTEADIRGWFAKLTSYLEEEELMAATLDPSRVYNGDETSFFLHPKTKAVLASRGSKNVYECEHADGHKNITTMFTFGADGSVVPPCVILPMQRIPTDILRLFPKDWGIGKSLKGWMDAINFMLYIRNVFYPFLLKKKVKFPVLFFVDGHSSHMAAEVAELCLDLGIILIALYPNTTRITQPADVAIFKPLKSAWMSAVANWRLEHGGEILTLKHFPGVLQKAMEMGIKKTSIVNGFRVCGLFPFGPNNVDYEKCIAKTAPQNEPNPEASDVAETIEQNPGAAAPEEEFPDFQLAAGAVVLEDSIIIPTSTIQAAIDCIGRERINGLNNGSVISEEGLVIQKLYEMLLLPFDSQNIDAGSDNQEESLSLHDNIGDDSAFVEDVGENVFEAEEQFDIPSNVMCERNEQSCTGRKMSISELLQTPPTPHRSNRHRNYKRTYHPVLTSSERLEEIYRIQEEKENEVARKKARVEERERLKVQTEQLKQEKAEIRKRRQEEAKQLKQQKQEEAELRKKKKEKGKQSKLKEINQQKQQKVKLLEALKLKWKD